MMDFSFHCMKTKEKRENTFLNLGSTSIPFFLKNFDISCFQKLGIAEFLASNLH